MSANDKGEKMETVIVVSHSHDCQSQRTVAVDENCEACSELQLREDVVTGYGERLAEFVNENILCGLPADEARMAFGPLPKLPTIIVKNKAPYERAVEAEKAFLAFFKEEEIPPF
tara:strand:+ start:5706 stop:6050 length:345 start_codon:yes stop_codon:yes gene_type:complete